MSFVLRFTPTGFTAAKYDEVLKQLEAAGAGAPKGRSYHVCYGDPEGLNVTDTWDSMEDFQAFGETRLAAMDLPHQLEGLSLGQRAGRGRLCDSGQKARRQQSRRQKTGQQGAHECPEYHEPGRQKQTLQNLNSDHSSRFLSPEKQGKSVPGRFETNPCL